jgi:hypothetical protein|tara:strand:+ start:86 stop:220 length:135 start_codon:yes stop_codon:yes gene_type:complete
MPIISGDLVYGLADSPTEEQFRQGMDYFKQQRKRKREILQAMKK